MMSDVIRMMAIVDMHFICITTSPWGVGRYESLILPEGELKAGSN